MTENWIKFTFRKESSYKTKCHETNRHIPFSITQMVNWMRLWIHRFVWLEQMICFVVNKSHWTWKVVNFQLRGQLAVVRGIVSCEWTMSSLTIADRPTATHDRIWWRTEKSFSIFYVICVRIWAEEKLIRKTFHKRCFLLFHALRNAKTVKQRQRRVLQRNDVGFTF